MWKLIPKMVNTMISDGPLYYLDEGIQKTLNPKDAD